MASTSTALNILVTASTAQAQAKLKAVDAQMKKTAATSGVTAGSMGKLGKGGMVAAGGFVAAAAAAAIAGKQLYDVGKELDEAYDTIRTGTGATGKQLEKLKKDFRSVAGQVPDDFATTGTAVADLNTRLGLSGKPLRQMSKNMLNLSRITKTDLEGNIKSVARSFVDWEVPVKKQSAALDGLFRLGQKSGSSVAEIADNMQKFGSPLRTLGYSVGEAAAMFANFERAGVNMQTMVPGLKLAIGNLADPTDDLRGKLEGLGVAAGKPEKGLKQIMELLGSDSKLKGVEKMNLAMDVFGKRAGADMAEAIKQGRFNLKDFIDEFKNGNDTIDKTSRDTRDAAENMGIFWNKVKILMAPVATWIFNAISDITLVLSQIPLNKIMGDVKRFMKTNQDWKDSIKAVGEVIRVFGDYVKWVFSKVIPKYIDGLITTWKGAFNIIKGIVRLVSAVLTGDFRKAWSAVKQIWKGAIQFVLGVLRSMTAPVRGILGTIGDAMSNTFESAWDRVKSIFEGGKSAVIGVINSIIRAINKIPGVPDIAEIGTGTSSRLTAGSRRSNIERRQRGGMLSGGAPSGDSIPAMLERGEYVLNRKAVQAAGGPAALDKFNFRAAPRFQQGGSPGRTPRTGGPLDAVGDVWQAAQGAAGKIFGKAASFFIDKLPKPDIPEPLTGVGPWVIKEVTDWIKGKVSLSSGSGPLGTASGNLGAFERLGHSYGLSTTSGFRAGDPGYHGLDRARDLSNGSGPTPQMLAFANEAGSRWGSSMKELIYTPLGWAIKDGQRTAPYAADDHYDHVHGAFQKGGLVGKIARMARGGSPWKKTGYTVYNDPPPGSFGGLDNGYAELGTATTSGLTGGGYLAQLFGRNGELPENYPLDVKINGKIKKLLKRDRGWGQGSSSHGIDIWQDSWPFFGLNSNSSGNAYVRRSGSGGGGGKKGKGGGGVKQPDSGGVRPDPNWGGDKHTGDTALDKQRAADKRKAAARRKKIIDRISARGLKFPTFDKLRKSGGRIDSLGEEINIAEQMGSADFGPGGSEITESELAQQIKLYQSLMTEQSKRFWVIGDSITYVSALREKMAGLIAQAKARLKTNLTPNVRAKVKGNLGAYRRAYGNTGDTLTDLGADKTELIGLTGKGGSMFDTRMRLQELGGTVPGGTPDNSELLSLMREQLLAANRNLAISQAQMPIFQQFMPKYHTGGIVAGAGEVPIMAQAGEGVFTRNQMAAMGGPGEITVNVIVEDGAVDKRKIRAEAVQALNGIATKVRTGGPAAGRSYSTRG